MKKTLFFILIIFAYSNSFAQNSIWKSVGQSQITEGKLNRDSNPSQFVLYSLNIELLKSQLQAAPSRSNIGQESNLIVAFPNPKGEMQKYRIYEAAVMHPELEARYPGIKSYLGKGVDDASAMIRFSVTLFGLHTMSFSGKNETAYIDPYTKDLKNYIVYNKSALSSTKNHICNVIDNEIDLDPIDDLTLLRADNSLFKTYRLAMACTIEYAAFHVNAAGLSGGTLAQKKAAVLAAMVVTMTRVNGVYERDLAITMVLIPNNDVIINITSDNYSNNDGPTLLDENQTAIDAAIGSANYDIGHVVSTGGGGIAQLQSPCGPSKARGVTGLDSPVGDSYDIDFVAHEIGHQWGGSHTFNSVSGGCGGGNRSSSSAFEPGSGTTIMAYAGLCSPEDVQPNSDAYMHARSLIQMSSFINGNGNCGVILANNNTPPVVDVGGNNTIPFGTAFVLTGSATDIDNPSGNLLTYCWEQYNFLPAAQPLTSTNTGGPNFRSINPSLSPIRYFPKLASVIANNLAPLWEVVPTVARALTFSLVVRDNGTPLGGQTQRVTKTVTIANTGPFVVTSQNLTEAWVQNTVKNITWSVAGTDANGINTSFVNIKLSTDGGLTFPILLIGNTPNDGSENIIVPNLVSQTCRLMVEAVGNIYYAVNTAPFYIGYEILNTCVTYNFTTPFNLNDGSSSYTQKTINVPTAGIISDVNITINATHPNLQNLNIAVVRPGGSLASLFSQQCAGNANMNITFDSQGSPLVCGSPTQGTYIPPTGFNLNTFNTFQQQGNWVFGFRDLVAGNAGTINSIALEVCAQTIILSAQDFNFENLAIYPNPNNGNFSVQFNSKANDKINITVYDLSGRIILDKNFIGAGLFSQNLQLDKADSGVYFVSITDGEHKTVKRILVE